MSITDTVDVTVTKEGASITRAGFGTPAFVNDNSVQTAPTRVLVHFSLAEIVTAGFLTTSQYYLWAQTVFSQPISPDRVVTIWWDFAGSAETLTAALTAAEASDDDKWYFTNIDSRAEADIVEVATWTEARRKMFVAQSSDADLLNGVAANVGEVLRLASRLRTVLAFHLLDTEFLDGGWTGFVAAFDLDAPNGVGTWKSKQLGGVTINAIQDGDIANIKAENANVYVQLFGRGHTEEGTSSEGEFADVQTTLDWLEARAQEFVFGAQATVTTKVPFTNRGIGLMGNQIERLAELSVVNGHLSDDSEPVVGIPDVTDIDPADKNARILNPPLTLDGILSGAIHTTKVAIKVTA